MISTDFSDLVDLCNSLEATTKRKEKIKLLAEFLRILEPEEVSPAVLMIVGSIFPEFDSRVLEVGWRTVKQALERRTQTTLFKESLSIKKVHDTLRRIAESEGPGSRKFKTTLLEGLMSSADSRESDILVRIIFREMRIGVNEGMMLEGIARAAKLETALVRRALMLTGNLGRVAEIALNTGEEGLKLVKICLFTPCHGWSHALRARRNLGGTLLRVGRAECGWQLGIRYGKTGG